MNQILQTVSFTLFGDQYDTKEERLLLLLFDVSECTLPPSPSFFSVLLAFARVSSRCISLSVSPCGVAMVTEHDGAPL